MKLKTVAIAAAALALAVGMTACGGSASTIIRTLSRFL